MGKPFDLDDVRFALTDRERWQKFDPGCPGLVLRSGKTGANWECRMNRVPPVRRMIGTPFEMSLEEAREVVRRARDAHKKRVLISEEWIDATRQEIGVGKSGYVPPLPQRPPAVDGAWTLDDGIDEYGRHLESKGRAALTISDSRKDARLLLGDAFNGRRMGDIRADEISLIAHEVAKERYPTAKRSLNTMQKIWKWASSPAVTERSGVSRNVIKDVELQVPADDPAPDLFSPPPSPAQVAQVVAIARAAVLRPVASAAIEMIALTGLSPGAVARARVEDITPVAWLVPSERSGARQGDVSYPLTTIRHLLDLAADGWVFPEIAETRFGGRSHLAVPTLTIAVRELPLGLTAAEIRRAFRDWMKREYDPVDVSRFDSDRYVSDDQDFDVSNFRTREDILIAWRKTIEALMPEASAAIDLDAVRRSVKVVKTN